MKLNYLVLGFEPLRVKFFYEEKGRDGEFYIDFSREAKDANNMTDKLGVRGVANLIGKDPDYANDLLQGLAEELKEGFDEPDDEALEAKKENAQEAESTGN